MAYLQTSISVCRVVIFNALTGSLCNFEGESNVSSNLAVNLKRMVSYDLASTFQGKNKQKEQSLLNTPPPLSPNFE